MAARNSPASGPLPVVRIVGGLVVTAFGWKLLQSGDAEDGPNDFDEHHRRLNVTDCFYPLTMPVTIGPGSVAITLALRSEPLDIRSRSSRFWMFLFVGGDDQLGLGGLRLQALDF
jgi:small neutral amino acid transporter SnatA (MarC family)